jgi:hypothetical protein
MVKIDQRRRFRVTAFSMRPLSFRLPLDVRSALPFNSLNVAASAGGAFNSGGSEDFLNLNPNRLGKE